MKKPKTIKQYIGSFPKEVSDRLKVVDDLIKKISPESVQTISYGMPAYKLDRKILVYFAGHKNHIGLYPYPSAIEAFKKYTEQYKTAKGSIQFQNDEKFPVDLITKIIKFRIKETTKKICSRKHVFYGAGPCPVCWPGRLKRLKK